MAGVEAERAHAAKVQDALYRIAELASAAQEMQEFYRAIHEVVGELMFAQNLYIALWDEERRLINWAYSVDEVDEERPDPSQWLAFGEEGARGVTAYVLRTGEPQHLSGERILELRELGEIDLYGELAEDWLGVPLKSEDGRTVGVLVVQSYTKDIRYTDQDEALLAFVGRHIGVALSRARAIEETRQRNAELALINSVQEALAGELDMQAIYDVVGDRIREIFDAQVVDIAVYDEASGLIHTAYLIERGKRFQDEPHPLGGFAVQVVETRQPLMINEAFAEAAEKSGSPVKEGTEPSKSALFVPLLTGRRVTGIISLHNLDREHAFGEADQRLLTTLAGDLTVALENARLVHETRQRNAELALINSVQSALAGQLEMQAIYDVVGDKIQEIFDAQGTCISIADDATGLVSFPYLLERGERLSAEPTHVSSGFTGHVLETREPLMINEDLAAEAERQGSFLVAGELPKSLLFVPLVTGGRALGVISLENYDREHAFDDADQRLLTTLAGSLTVALENARLVHETRQRNAELALINGVQEAIAGELDSQAIYDAVGDRIRAVFDAQVVSIVIYDEAIGDAHIPYVIERGERLHVEPRAPVGFTRHVLETRESLLLREDVDAEAKRYGSPTVAGDTPKSALFVPLVTSGKATGVLSLQNVDRERAFSESDQQLLETLAGSLSVALENARLVHETRQRNAELALINGVQEAIAGELEPQAIYDAVGDNIRDVFDAQVVQISMLGEGTGLLYDRYLIERGERMEGEPWTPSGFSKFVLETREPLLVVENIREAAKQHGSEVVEGSEMPRSVLFVPLATGGRATGVISLQNVDREHAFSDSDQQLLETLAGSLSVALENARLVHETRQRNAELALINSVQDAIAGELEPQAIYDAVGDRLRDVFDAQVVSIVTVDEASGMVQFPYIIERGERLFAEPQPLAAGGFSRHVIDTREPLLIAENMDAEAERYGSPTVAGEATKSALFVPLVAGGKATGVISLQNADREHAFGESEQQLLETLAGSLSVALENARLVHETRQRNAELALINGVQDAIAGELDPQRIYDAVGDRLRDVFDAQVVSIATVDEQAGLVQYPYLLERGERLQAEPRPLAGFAKHVLETREALLIAENLDAETERYGSSIVAGERPKSALFVPLVAGGKGVGVISLQNIDREHAFGEDDQRLLTTLAGSLNVALENARLVQETRQRVAELGTVNSVGHALSSQLDPEALIELVGEQVRETFEADIAYVALHDESSGQIEFAYYYESGERRPEAPMEYGEGLTTQILESREPLLLNRREQLEGQEIYGTPSLSYLGVPILVGNRAIGVISVQSIAEEGRFGEPDARLLATIAANVGVAIQNARLFTEIARQKQYFESLVEISPAAIVVMDAGERVTGWNPAAAALFGYTSDEAVGRTIDELVVPDEYRSESRDVTIEALEEVRTHRITQRARKDGGLLDVEMELVPLRFDGEHVGFYAIYHDITELQRARQEAEAATQAKSAFLATMSHEIRTPMNAVIGMTDLLLGTDLSGEQREFAEVVHSSGDALLHVIDDILDYSKIEAGKLDLEREPFNLRDCVEGALDIVAPRAWEKELELGCLIDDDAPAGVVGDEARLRQVLLNLLSNAVKFTERGEVVVLVDAEETGTGSYRVELAVRDTGIGIPPDRMDLLFTSFSQVDASTTRRFGGTGLGLAISKRLVELMGGTISVESEQKKGSTFRISLPVTAADVPAKIALDEGLPHLAGKRILIVDDNATNREIVTRHARSWEMEPVAVELPADALELIAAGEPFDVAVLDMMMPDMDGLALAGEIRSRKSAEELPLLLLTSLGRLPQAESSNLFSAQLAKPFKASQLYNTLLRLLTAGRPGGRRGSARDRRQAREVGATDPARGGQRHEPKGGLAPARATRLPRRCRDQRSGGDRGARAAALRRRPDGRADAGARRPRRDAPDLRALARGDPSPHHRDDGERPSRGSRGVLRSRHERLRGEADPRRGAGGSAEACEAARERARQPRRRGAGESPRSRRRRVPRRGDRRVPRGCADADRDAPELAGLGQRRGAAARGAHAEVERRDARRRRVRGPVPDTRAACEGGRARRLVRARRPDRGGVPATRGSPLGTSLARVNRSAPAAGTILIAEDNRVNRLLLARGLEQEGHTIVFAEHGREALDLMGRQPFDLLLLDVLMPELDGYEVLAKLQDDPHLRDIPVIVTSALDELDSVVRCLEMGAEDYLTKPVNPVLLKARINASLEKKRLRDQQRELISKFATKEVADDLLTSGFSLGGQYVEASAMFCDIRSFTTISESREPAETIELLNDYYLLMMDAINGEGGIVNQMIGDGLMAIFGAPAPREDHRQAAVLAARQMVELIRLFNEEQAARDKVQIQIGVGVASGRVVAGYTGTQNRATYTCVGDTVNVAARLEAHTKELGRPILIDENTRQGLDDGIAVEAQGDLLMKGKTEPTRVYAVLVEAAVAWTA